MTPAGTVLSVILAAFGTFSLTNGQLNGEPYYGTRIGKFSTHFHDVKGDVYAVDERTIYIKNFNYDGKGTDTFFWAGTSVRPDPSGFTIPDETGSVENLKPYSNKDIILRLPQGKRLKDIRWLSVWSKRFRANFGSLVFPKALQPPRPAVIGRLQGTKHGVSSGDIMIIDTHTFLVQDFSYDGSKEGVFWWLSRGMKPNTGGLQLLDENHSRFPLRKYINETVVVSVPEGQIIFDFDTLSVWSSVDIEDYGMVKIPKDIKVPPSARSLGISPQNKLNCEMLNDNLGFEARWVVEEDQLIMQLIGKFDANEYMALGFSKDDTETKFPSSDAVLVYLSEDGRGHAIDYFLQSTEKCENGQGMCPDTVFEGGNNSITLLNAGKVRDSVTVTFRRALKAVDEKYDQNIYTDGPQAVLWAVGDISENGEAMPPKLRTRGNLLLDFGRDPLWNCPLSQEAASVDLPEEQASKKQEHRTAKVHCPMDLTFRAQLGPPVKKNSPERIWYINGLPSPDITIQRGQTYTFIVEGGGTPPIHHPLYITSSEEGGIYQKILEANEDGESVYAGVASDPTGALLPTAEGRLCEWTFNDGGPEFSVLNSEMETENPLRLSCIPGNAGLLTWTPDVNASEKIYYQSFIQKNMGGRITVVDFCEESVPHHYLQETDRRHDNPHHRNDGENVNIHLERESEDRESDLPGNMKNFFTETNPDSLDKHSAVADNQSDKFVSHNGEREFLSERHEYPEQKSHDSSRPNTDINNLIETRPHSFYGKERINPNSMHSHHPNNENIPITQSALDQEASEGNFAISSYPYDEYERSDTNILDISSTENSNQHRSHAIVQDPQRGGNRVNLEMNPQLQKGSQNAIKSSTLLNVQFEGGFVPLVMNPSKEKESAVHPDYIHPPPHFRRHRPFLFNESIPFHGTFKPGVPDFSGFNISHYTQAASAIDQNHLSDHIALLSAPKPQISQRPSSNINALGPDIFRRPHNGMHRPQVAGYGLNPQMIILPGHQEPMFFQLPGKQQPNFLVPRPGEDLDEGSSQRVPISLQSPNEKQMLKNKHMAPGFPMRQPGNRHIRPGFIPPKQIPPSPPIQRRPDIVEEDVNHQKLPTSNNYQASKVPIRDNTDQQIRSPNLVPSRLRPQPYERQTQHGNGRLPNMHHHLQVPERNNQEQTLVKQPNGFLKRPIASHPLEQGSRPNGPFIYHLPDRPIPQLALQHPPSIDQSSTDLRFAPPKTAHQLPPNPQQLPNSLPEDFSSVQQVYGMPLQQGRPVLKQDFGLPQNMPAQPERPSNFQSNFNSFEGQKNPNMYQQENPENILPIMEKTAENEQVLDSTNFNLGAKQNSEAQNEAYEETETDEGNLPLEYEEVPADGSDLPEETTEFSEESDESLDTTEINEDRIISVEQSHSQEIHLPPMTLESPQDTEHFDSTNKQKDVYEELQHTPHAELPNRHTYGEYEVQPEANPSETLENSNEPPFGIPHIDYDYDAVPFGARLNVKPPPESNIPVKHYDKPLAPKRHPYFPARRQPQYSSPPPMEIPHFVITKPPHNPEHKETLSESSSSSQSKSHYIQPNDQNMSEEQDSPMVSNSEIAMLSIHPGRKNILPSESNENDHSVEAPPKVPENIKLPHISEKPPTHDNGTDYSILSHVLSLIGGQPQDNAPSPRNAK